MQVGESIQTALASHHKRHNRPAASCSYLARSLCPLAERRQALLHKGQQRGVGHGVKGNAHQRPPDESLRHHLCGAHRAAAGRQRARASNCKGIEAAPRFGSAGATGGAAAAHARGRPKPRLRAVRDRQLPPLSRCRVRSPPRRARRAEGSSPLALHEKSKRSYMRTEGPVAALASGQRQPAAAANG